MVASGRINLKRLVSHRFTLEDTEKAFETAASRESNAVKVVIQCSQSEQ